MDPASEFISRIRGRAKTDFPLDHKTAKTSFNFIVRQWNRGLLKENPQTFSMFDE